MKTRNYWLALLSLALALVALAAACAPAAQPSRDATGTAPLLPSGAPAKESSLSTGQTLPGETQRLIVRTATLTLMVTSVVETVDRAAKLAERVGGFVVSSNTYESGDRTLQPGVEPKKQATVSIRVPADRFEEAMAELRTFAVEVRDERTDSQDVTEEYSDLQAQLKNLKATEAQLLELMQKAQKVDEVLSVQRELSRVRGDIERLQGRIQYLERTSQTSLISMNILPTEAALPLIQKWSALEQVRTATRALVVTAQAVATLAIWLLIFVPLWALIALAVWLPLRLRRKKKPPSKPAS